MNSTETTVVAPATPQHARILSEASYVRERVAPGLRDPNYPHLSDLMQYLKEAAGEVQGELFDYGCGGAPYRSLFSKCRRYVAADIEANPAVDLVLKPDGSTGVENSSFDVVLSTQVLEHIQDPEKYLRECHRILRPGGRLILTTHGMFEEHGCPHDYLRWTARGLVELVERCGFRATSSHKLTTELRGFVQLTHQMMFHLRCPKNPLTHYLLAVPRKLHHWIGMPFMNWFADRFPGQAIVPGDDPASLYVCVAVRAIKS